MGYNATVVVMIDALDAIKDDTKFGEKLASAISKKTVQPHKPLDVSAGNHVNAATVIETHHADYTTLLAIGGNYGAQIGKQLYGWAVGDDAFHLKILKEVADELGYRLVKKPTKKSS